GGENVAQAATEPGQVRARASALVDPGDDAHDLGDGTCRRPGQHRVPGSQPAIAAIPPLDAQLLAQNLALTGTLNRDEMPAELLKISGVNEPLELRQPEAVGACGGKPENVARAVAQERDAPPRDVVDVDHIGRGADHTSQHALCALFAVLGGTVEH